MPNTLNPADVLKGDSPLVLTATLEPVAGDRFQPAGFPEIGHVIYKAPRKDATVEHVCIVDSAASMANHLESVCQRGAHDLDLVEELDGLPYIRCVTGDPANGRLPSDKREILVASLTEGHRIASTYFLEGELLKGDKLIATKLSRVKSEADRLKKAADGEADASKKKAIEKQAKDKQSEARRLEEEAKFKSALIERFGIVLPGSSKAHPPASQWWKVFETIFELDPNSLVHGVLFPKWQIKIPRALTAHLEAFGAGRVDRAGVKFDRLGKTTSGQPIFAVDDATAESIRATFVLDVSLIRSFGRWKGDEQLGLTEERQELLVALALWKVWKLLESPFRYRSGCHLRRTALQSEGEDVVLAVDIKSAIKAADFGAQRITDVFWPREELYRKGAQGEDKTNQDDNDTEGGDEE